jgi:hypothetical protein
MAAKVRHAAAAAARGGGSGGGYVQWRWRALGEGGRGGRRWQCETRTQVQHLRGSEGEEKKETGGFTSPPIFIG